MTPHEMSRARGRLALAADLLRAHSGAAAETGIPVATGVMEIDAALPGGGLRPGLHEIAAPFADPARAGFAALLAARRPGPILWCRARAVAADSGDPYGVGLGAFGLTTDRLILVDALRPADLLWAMEEGAHTRGLAAVVGEGAAPDLTASRRLQLAAEAGDGIVLLLPPVAIRPIEAGLRPSAARTRWIVRSQPSVPDAGGPGRPRWHVELGRGRGGGRPQGWLLEWDDMALSLSVVQPPSVRLPASATLSAAG